MGGFLMDESIPHFYSVPMSWSSRNFPSFFVPPEPFGELVHDVRPQVFSPFIHGIKKEGDRQKSESVRKNSKDFQNETQLKTNSKNLKKEIPVSHDSLRQPTAAPHSNSNQAVENFQNSEPKNVIKEETNNGLEKKEDLVNASSQTSENKSNVERVRSTDSMQILKSSDESAKKIQSAYRGYCVRKTEPLKNLRLLARIKKEANELEHEMRIPENLNKLKADKKEKVRINESLMSLLLRLDTVQCSDFFVRSVRKSLAKQIVSLQDSVDSLPLEIIEQVKEIDSKVTSNDQSPVSPSPFPSPKPDELVTHSDLSHRTSTFEPSIPDPTAPDQYQLQEASITSEMTKLPNDFNKSTLRDVKVEGGDKDSWIVDIYHPSNKSEDSNQTRVHEIHNQNQIEKENEKENEKQILNSSSTGAELKGESPVACEDPDSSCLDSSVDKFESSKDKFDSLPNSPSAEQSHCKHSLEQDSELSSWRSVVESLAEENRKLQQMLRKQLETNMHQTEVINAFWNKMNSFEQALRSESRRRINEEDALHYSDAYPSYPKPSRYPNPRLSPLVFDGSTGKEDYDANLPSFSYKAKPRIATLPSGHEHVSFSNNSFTSENGGFVPQAEFPGLENRFGHRNKLGLGGGYERPVYYFM